jgi:cyclopropane fatty-acyl-phospholipid synthase-like methyltransferase
VEYDAEIAERYAASRNLCAEVLACLVREGRVDERSRVLEVGCGSGNYLRALAATTTCAGAGIDPSADMLAEARRLGGIAELERARAEDVANVHGRSVFDLVFSVDVIHHVSDPAAYFAGAREVLRTGGRICTVTDSEDIIRRRRPLSEYWPETVSHELRRYPSVDFLSDSLRGFGFSEVRVFEVSREYQLDSAAAYERRAFSCLHLISDEEFVRGLARLRAALSIGPVVASTRYVLIWGTKP